MKIFAYLCSLLFLSASPIADYCKRSETPPQWERISTQKGEKHRFHVLDIVSQKWRSEKEVDRSEWHHTLSIVEPEKITSDKALLIILGGMSGDPAPAGARPEWVALANQTGSIVVEVRNVPNQPIKFTDEPDERYKACGCKEDALVAYTWDRYLETEEESWISTLPMTKSVVSAMDVIQEAAPKLFEGDVSIKGFVLSGRSKRGWTAWTAASVDERVVGVAPMVINLLNLKRSLEHHYRSYGSWSFALRDYVDRKIPERWDTIRFDELLQVIEPYAQKESVKAPKLIVNSTGDEFFLPDSSRFYFHDLEGEKYLRYIPNVSHDLKGSDANKSLALFYNSLLRDRPLPKFSWERKKERLVITTQTRPLEVKVWSAQNPCARDFRLSTIGPSWESKPLSPKKGGLYEVSLPKPKKGWAAYVVELKFDSGEKTPHTFTTDVFVTPESLPYEFKGYALNS